MGAYNTVVRSADGTLTGYNTDGIGFYRSITEETNLVIAGQTCFCFGAGGAGRAICAALAYHGAQKIYILDICVASGKALVADINANFAPIAEFVPCGNFAPVAARSMVINATGIGMGATEGQSPLPPEHIRPRQFYFDAATTRTGRSS